MECKAKQKLKKKTVIHGLNKKKTKLQLIKMSFSNSWQDCFFQVSAFSGGVQVNEKMQKTLIPSFYLMLGVNL